MAALMSQWTSKLVQSSTVCASVRTMSRTGTPVVRTGVYGSFGTAARRPVMLLAASSTQHTSRVLAARLPFRSLASLKEMGSNADKPKEKVQPTLNFDDVLLISQTLLLQLDNEKMTYAAALKGLHENKGLVLAER